MQYITFLDNKGVFSGVLNPTVMIFYGNQKYCSANYYRKVYVQTDAKPLFYLYWVRDTGSKDFVESLQEEIDGHINEHVPTQQLAEQEIKEKSDAPTKNNDVKLVCDTKSSISSAKPTVATNNAERKINFQEDTNKQTFKWQKTYIIPLAVAIFFIILIVLTKVNGNSSSYTVHPSGMDYPTWVQSTPNPNASLKRIYVDNGEILKKPRE